MELLRRNFMPARSLPARGHSGAFRTHSYRMVIDKRAKNLKRILYQALAASALPVFWACRAQKRYSSRRPRPGHKLQANSAVDYSRSYAISAVQLLLRSGTPADAQLLYVHA